MDCPYEELKSGSYKLVTQDEIRNDAILKASQHFLPEQKRILEHLKHSYPCSENLILVRGHQDLWRRHPHTFLALLNPEHADGIFQLYMIWERTKGNTMLNRLIRRSICVVLAQLHQTRSRTDELVARVLQCSSDKSKAAVTQTFYRIFRYGTKWQEAIRLFSQESQHESPKQLHYGIIWLLGMDRPWERASKDVIGVAMSYLRRDTNLYAESKSLSPSVGAVLKYLRGVAALNAYTSPRLQLTTQTVIPDNHVSIQFAIGGDIDSLKPLFIEGLLSPRAVSYSREFSLLRWALYGGIRNYPTVKFLLSWGATLDESSYQHAWESFYGKRCTNTEFDELRCTVLQNSSTYASRDWLEEQRFPLVHDIILGRSPKSLYTEIRDNPECVRSKDVMGRTALDWATARAQLSDMKLLISYGSPTDTMDTSGRTTILHAVDSHSYGALRIILEAGANPNPAVPDTLFRSSPLIAATFGGLKDMMKLLIDYGAKVDACNPEGRTALQVTAGMQDVECADILLTHGADMRHKPSNGHCPLATAIVFNNHAVLQFFISWARNKRLKKLQLISLFAESADAKTLSILAACPELL